MLDLEGLRGLYVWMCEARVLHARSGELELRLESLPPLRTVDIAPTNNGEEDEEQRSLEELLYSSGAATAPFLAAMQRRTG